MYNKDAWIEILSTKLPGEQAQLRMAPTFRGHIASLNLAKEAAVLALLYPSDGRLHLVFIKRNEYDGPHSAQISFPGGIREEGDLSLEDTALREAREEVGIDGEIEVLGKLTPLHIPVSNFMVYPFVGWMTFTPLFHPDPSEVQYVVEAALEDLLDLSNRDSETLFHHDMPIEAPYFRIGKEKIWGATAMILSELLQLATSLR
jgi:8-oxo-dGTP pyrophosphatase MutT (NUDIX family)